MFVSDLLDQVTAGMAGLLAEDWDGYGEGALSDHLSAMAEQLERMHAAVLGCATVGRTQGVGVRRGGERAGLAGRELLDAPNGRGTTRANGAAPPGQRAHGQGPRRG